MALINFFARLGGSYIEGNYRIIGVWGELVFDSTLVLYWTGVRIPYAPPYKRNYHIIGV